MASSLLQSMQHAPQQLSYVLLLVCNYLANQAGPKPKTRSLRGCELSCCLHVPQVPLGPGEYSLTLAQV
jgi:hypothetical protein